MIRRNILILTTTLLLQTGHAQVEEIYPLPSQADSARFKELTETIRCVVCQNQNIADSNAPLANDLREKVYQMVLAKKSNTDIQNYLVKRYGEFILLNPRVSSSTALLWFFPLIGLSVAGLLIAKRLRRKHQAVK